MSAAERVLDREQRRTAVIVAARQVSALLEMTRDDDTAGPNGNPYGISPSAGRVLRIHHDALIAAVAALDAERKP